MRGIEFPIIQSKKEENIKMNDNIENIKQSIRIILLTNKGERYSNKDFGCSMGRFMFEPITEYLIKDLSKEVRESILKNESRVKDLDINVIEGKNQGALRLEIVFKSVYDREDQIDIDMNLNP